MTGLYVTEYVIPRDSTIACAVAQNCDHNQALKYARMQARIQLHTRTYASTKLTNDVINHASYQRDGRIDEQRSSLTLSLACIRTSHSQNPNCLF